MFSNIFSEPEARAIANFLQADELRGRLDAFVCHHSFQIPSNPFISPQKDYPPYLCPNVDSSIQS